MIRHGNPPRRLIPPPPPMMMMMTMMVKKHPSVKENCPIVYWSHLHLHGRSYSRLIIRISSFSFVSCPSVSQVRWDPFFLFSQYLLMLNISLPIIYSSCVIISCVGNFRRCAMDSSFLFSFSLSWKIDSVTYILHITEKYYWTTFVVSDNKARKEAPRFIPVTNRSVIDRDFAVRYLRGRNTCNWRTCWRKAVMDALFWWSYAFCYRLVSLWNGRSHPKEEKPDLQDRVCGVFSSISMIVPSITLSLIGQDFYHTIGELSPTNTRMRIGGMFSARESRQQPNSIHRFFYFDTYWTVKLALSSRTPDFAHFSAVTIGKKIRW